MKIVTFLICVILQSLLFADDLKYAMHPNTISIEQKGGKLAFSVNETEGAERPPSEGSDLFILDLNNLQFKRVLSNTTINSTAWRNSNELWATSLKEILGLFPKDNIKRISLNDSKEKIQTLKTPCWLSIKWNPAKNIIIGNATYKWSDDPLKHMIALKFVDTEKNVRYEDIPVIAESVAWIDDNTFYALEDNTSRDLLKFEISNHQVSLLNKRIMEEKHSLVGVYNNKPMLASKNEILLNDELLYKSEDKIFGFKFNDPYIAFRDKQRVYVFDCSSQKIHTEELLDRNVMIGTLVEKTTVYWYSIMESAIYGWNFAGDGGPEEVFELSALYRDETGSGLSK